MQIFDYKTGYDKDKKNKSIFVTGPEIKDHDNFIKIKNKIIDSLEKNNFSGSVYLSNQAKNEVEDKKWDNFHFKQADAILYWIDNEIKYSANLSINISLEDIIHSPRTVIGMEKINPNYWQLSCLVDENGHKIVYSIEETIRNAISNIKK